MVDDPRLRIESMAAGGRGVARLPSGKVVLVSGAAPGELVRAVVEQQKSKLSFARTEEVLEPSPDRIEPACPLAGRCGGCPWSHLEIRAQRRLKRQVLARELHRAGVGTDLDLPPVKGGAPLGYRWRTRLHLEKRNLGTLQVGSQVILPYEGCLILADPLDRYARETVRLCRGLPDLTAQLELYVDAEGRRGMHVLVDDAISAPTWERAARELDVHSLVVRGTEPGRAPWLTEKSGALALDFIPGVFVQANREMNAVLVELVSSEAGRGQRLYEAYAGAGNLTLGLAAGFQTGWAAEGDRAAARSLAHNLTTVGGHVTVHAEDERATHRRLRRGPVADLLVTDPPRRGMRRLLGRSLRPPSGRILMVSCHPVTAVRDLSALVNDGGYRLVSVTAVDMFPQTHHLELVALLSQR